MDKYDELRKKMMDLKNDMSWGVFGKAIGIGKASLINFSKGLKVTDLFINDLEEALGKIEKVKRVTGTKYARVVYK
jgi:hypothetical protein